MSNATASVLRPLFLPVVVAAVIAALAALDFWLFIQHGLRPAVHQVLIDPIVLLAVLGLTLVSAVFHELGHATACRYGGARPGAIGVGLYLIWPSFFTNVTDAYRLGRRGRLRTDLGGIYFNSVFILAVAGIYAATGKEALLLVILLGHLEMIEQLMPFVRFDGYFILSDLAGIPDLFARIGPVLNNALQRGRIADPRIQGLRRSSRLLVTFWTVLTVPLLGLNLGYLVLHLPSIDGALWTSMRIQATTTGRAVAGGMYAAGVIEVIGVALLALSIGGTLYITSGTVVRLARFARRWTSDRARERALVVALAAVVTTALLLVWVGWHEFSGWHV